MIVAVVTASALALAQPAQAGSGTAAPQGLQVTGVDFDSIDLAWEAPAGVSVAYYLIYRNGLWVNSSYGTAGSVDYLRAGTTHTIEVRARRTDYSLTAPIAVTATTKADASPPTTPSNLRLARDAYGRVSGLTWDASSDDRGVSTYRLFANGTEAFGGGLGVSFYSLTDEFCTVFSGQTYTFTVKAQDLSGNLSPTGTSVTVTVP